MNQPKNYWAANVRLLRRRRKLSQETLAAELGMSRSKLNAHENGQTANPAAGDMIRVSGYFGISIDTLLKTDLAALSGRELRELETGGNAYETGSNIRVLAISVDKKGEENLEYVPVKARAGYRSGCNDPDYIASLPAFTLPGLSREKTYRMFPSTGDSMLPIPEGASVITEYVSDWTSLKAATPCIVILRSEGRDFVFKLVTFLAEERSLELRSLNEMYDPYRVAVSEVLEIWKYHSHLTDKLPGQETPAGELSVLLRQMHADIRALKKNN
jgi:transcriptional regulator with XRE-family HTH domain